MIHDDDQVSPAAQDPLIKGLTTIIRLAVRAMAVMMTAVIVLGVVDVAWTLHQKAMAAPRYILTISDILGIFGAFMAVLIAIEIFVNITVYLRESVIHVRIVIATALMAIARKVIILDFESTESDYVWATAGVVLSMSIAYWLVVRPSGERVFDLSTPTTGEESNAGQSPNPPSKGAI